MRYTTAKEMLEFQLAHARARDAVHYPLDSGALVRELGGGITVQSAARDRTEYLRRPDLGRRLSEEARALLEGHKGEYDVAFVIADGLSALAVHRHAPGLLSAVRETSQAPLTIVEQGRVAIGDEIGSVLGAALVVVLIGERPGLSSPDSLGVYLTWGPRPGRTDAERNCISNIRAEGLSTGAAAELLRLLMTESRARRLSGVTLKPRQTFPS
jgi:ethanolamine ammonia-lyase small subunit